MKPDEDSPMAKFFLNTNLLLNLEVRRISFETNLSTDGFVNRFKTNETKINSTQV